MDVVVVHWERDAADVKAVRRAVFVEEQQISEQLEWDGKDAQCEHVLVRASDGRAIATGRLQGDGRIGRMAVLKAWRGRGVGGAILTALVDRARALGYPRVYVSAQQHAVPFYEAHAFASEGPVYEEAGIPHRRMNLALE